MIFIIQYFKYYHCVSSIKKLGLETVKHKKSPFQIRIWNIIPLNYAIMDSWGVKSNIRMNNFLLFKVLTTQVSLQMSCIKFHFLIISGFCLYPCLSTQKFFCSFHFSLVKCTASLAFHLIYSMREGIHISSCPYIII